MKYEQKRWFYLGISLIVAICSGIGYTWSVFQGPLIDRFGWSLSTASLIFTAQVLLSTLTPMALGRFQVKLGTRNYLVIGSLVYGLGLLGAGFSSSFIAFFLLFGVGVGVGIGMVYPCLMAYGVRIFPEKSGLAAGLLAGSYGAGAILWAPIAANLNESHGILAVYQILGACFTLINVVLVLFLKEPNAEMSPSSQKQSAGQTSADTVNMTWREMVRTKTFYMLLSLFALGTAAGLMIMGHASSILIETLNVTPTKAAYLVGFISVTNALGRVVFGIGSDTLGRFRVILILFAMIGLAMLCLFVADGALFVGAILIVGFAYGGFAALIAPATADLFGSKHVAVNYGFLYIAYGIGGMIGPQLAAYSKNLSGGYTTSFLIVSFFSVIGIVLAFLTFQQETPKRRQPATA